MFTIISLDSSSVLSFLSASCKHKFCFLCLKALHQSALPGQAPSCPLCRAPFDPALLDSATMSKEEFEAKHMASPMTVQWSCESQSTTFGVLLVPHCKFSCADVSHIFTSCNSILPVKCF